MQKIVPHLWFDKEAKEAAQFYITLFENSKIKSDNILHDTPSGDANTLTIQLAGQDFMLISAGPYFKFTPAISFLVACSSKEEVDLLWQKLSPQGSVLMDLGEYPFSARYGWLQDKYGLSWQIMYMGERPMPEQKITPTLMFVGDVVGKAEEAITFYTEVFHNSKLDYIMRYEKNEAPDVEGTIKYSSFTLEEQKFSAMDSAHEHAFTFTEAISFLVRCETQEEIDYYWNRLSAVPEAEQCGWLKDKYGVSWQVAPTVLDDLLASDDKEKIDRVTQAFLQMKKFDIALLKKAAGE